MRNNEWSNWELVEGVAVENGEHVVFAKQSGWVFFHAIDASLVASILFPEVA